MTASKPASFEYRAAAVGLTAPVVLAIVRQFYVKVRKDPVLAPIFERAIGHDWNAHIEKICLFWLTATRLGNGYVGRDFMPAHMKHRSIGSAEIARWLQLFRETVGEQCELEKGEVMLDIADRMAESIQLGIAQANSTRR